MKDLQQLNKYIKAFVKESNSIEGINRPPTKEEIEQTLDFIELERISIEDIQDLVHVMQPNAILRDKEGLNVRIGSYYPPKGGEEIKQQLSDLLEFVNNKGLIPTKNHYRQTYGDALTLLPNNPMECHRAYESLHPFTDGNGRSGRAIWAWQMYQRHGNKGLALGFLRHYYYQTLDQSRK